MPRRKRKSLDTRKAPLEFEESPFSGSFNPPSPVFCSDNPATADVVPVKESLLIPWVSPQFSKAPSYLSTVKKARRSKRLSSKSAESNSTSVVIPNYRTKKKVNSKLVPLRFECEKTPEPPSIIEEVTYEEDTPPIEDTKNPHTVHPVRPGLPGPGDCPRTRSVQLSFHSAHTEVNENGAEAPVTKTKTGRKNGIRKKTKSTRLKMNLDDLFSDDSEISLLAHGKHVGNVSLRHANRDNSASLKRSITGPHTPKSGFDQEENNGIINKDTIRDRVHVGVDAHHPLYDNYPSPHLDQENLSGLRMDLSTPTLSSQSRVPRSERDRLYGSFLTPDRKRRSLRVTQMFLPGTPVQNPALKPNYKVLAYDTPEEDYGVSVRKRYLKGIKLLKMKRLKQF